MYNINKHQHPSSNTAVGALSTCVPPIFSFFIHYEVQMGSRAFWVSPPLHGVVGVRVTASFVFRIAIERTNSNFKLDSVYIFFLSDNKTFLFLTVPVCLWSAVLFWVGIWMLYFLFRNILENDTLLYFGWILASLKVFGEF